MPPETCSSQTKQQLPVSQPASLPAELAAAVAPAAPSQAESLNISQKDTADMSSLPQRHKALPRPPPVVLAGRGTVAAAALQGSPVQPVWRPVLGPAALPCPQCERPPGSGLAPPGLDPQGQQQCLLAPAEAGERRRQGGRQAGKKVGGHDAAASV